MYDFLGRIFNRLDALERNQPKIRCGTVTSVTPFKCKMDGETTSIVYVKPSNYTPALNDRVFFICADGKYVCLGKYE